MAKSAHYDDERAKNRADCGPGTERSRDGYRCRKQDYCELGSVESLPLK